MFALGCVDGVIPHQTHSVASVILDYKPRVFIKGIDWQDQLPDDVLKACFECGTEIIFVNTDGKHVRQARG